MGIHAKWRDERGKDLEVLLDPHMLLSTHVLSSEYSETICLRFIDPYGIAVMNQHQIPILIEELERSKSTVRDPEVLGHVEQVLSLARRAVGRLHTYLWFTGD